MIDVMEILVELSTYSIDEDIFGKMSDEELDAVLEYCKQHGLYLRWQKLMLSEQQIRIVNNRNEKINTITMQNLDIDYLKQNQQRLYYFGLGFIQLVLNKEERIHFYNKSLQATNDEIHNHRYNFTSKILKGEFINHKYKLIKGNSNLLTNESCNKDIELTNKINLLVGVEKIETNIYHVGDSYDMFYNELHSVAYNGNTITHLTRTDIITDYAQVIYPINKTITCPFASNYDDKTLWELIEDTINS